MTEWYSQVLKREVHGLASEQCRTAPDLLLESPMPTSWDLLKLIFRPSRSSKVYRTNLMMLSCGFEAWQKIMVSLANHMVWRLDRSSLGLIQLRSFSEVTKSSIRWSVSAIKMKRRENGLPCFKSLTFGNHLPGDPFKTIAELEVERSWDIQWMNLGPNPLLSRSLITVKGFFKV